tara:strand:- start:838 stop:1008 length:171 start_codon:yes stop_codon:yes gene_type:complete
MARKLPKRRTKTETRNYTDALKEKHQSKDYLDYFDDEDLGSLPLEKIRRKRPNNGY